MRTLWEDLDAMFTESVGLCESHLYFCNSLLFRKISIAVALKVSFFLVSQFKLNCCETEKVRQQALIELEDACDW